MEIKSVPDNETRIRSGMEGFGETLFSEFLSNEKYFDIIIIYNDILVTSRLL
jgi:hypothetical protein